MRKEPLIEKKHFENMKPLIDKIIESEIIAVKERLKEDGIDINNEHYKENENFKKYYNEFYYFEYPKISHARFIEKYILGQDKLNRNSDNNYALGVDTPLTSKELTKNEFYEELALAVETIGKIRYKEDDVCKHEDLVKNIKYSFERRDEKGLLSKLKNILKLDIEKFNEQYRINQPDREAELEASEAPSLDKYYSREYLHEHFKLLYYLFTFEKENKIQLFSLFKKPTLENVDFSAIDINMTKNGKILSRLKDDISKELSQDFVMEANKAIRYIMEDWMSLLNKAIKLSIEPGELKDYYYNMLNNIFHLSSITVGILNEIKEDTDYKHSLFETFYLRLLQHEQIGRERDIIDVESEIPCHEPIPAMNDADLNMISKINIDFADLDGYVSNNRKFIAQYVFNKNAPGSNDYKKFDAQKTIVPLLINMYREHIDLPSRSKEKQAAIPLLLVISCYQALVNTKSGEKIKNPYYGIKTDATWYNEAKKGRDAHIKSQIAWCSRIRYYVSVNIGTVESHKLSMNINNNLDRIIEKIHQYQNIEEMLFLHDYIYRIIDAQLVTEPEISLIEANLNKAVHEATGYTVTCDDDIRIQFFREMYNSPKFIDGLKDMIPDSILKAENEHISSKCFLIEIEISAKEAYTKRQSWLKISHMLEFRVDIIDKSVLLYKYCPELSEEQKTIINSLGMQLLI